MSVLLFSFSWNGCVCRPLILLSNFFRNRSPWLTLSSRKYSRWFGSRFIKPETATIQLASCLGLRFSVHSIFEFVIVTIRNMKQLTQTYIVPSLGFFLNISLSAFASLLIFLLGGSGSAPELLRWPNFGNSGNCSRCFLEVIGISGIAGFITYE